jgi:hypothetical protein
VRITRVESGFAAIVCVLAFCPRPAQAQSKFEPVPAEAFNRAVPTDFYLEGERIPVEKRNAAVLKTPRGARLVVALLDTSGYSSQAQEKYTGMLITEARLAICGNPIEVGSYGFGLDRPTPPSDRDATFKIYNQAGKKVGQCAAERDSTLKQPRPLSIITPPGPAAMLCLGKYVIEIKEP